MRFVPAILHTPGNFILAKKPPGERPQGAGAEPPFFDHSHE